jgi:hypothetical protein
VSTINPEIPHAIGAGIVTPPRARPVRRFGQGRTCRAAGCSTRLSVYNASPFCWVHESRHDWVLRADRTVDDGPVLREDFRDLLGTLGGAA